MAKGNVLGKDRINSYYCISCPDMLKTYQRDTALFEFSRDTSREDLEIKKRRHFAMAFLQWLHCNGFRFSYSPMFTNKAIIFLDNVLYWGK